jgi:hypothetical protein
MLNETIVETMNAITPSGTIWIIKVLAIFGMFWLLQTLFKTGVNIVYLIAYIIASIGWLRRKIKGLFKHG